MHFHHLCSSSQAYWFYCSEWNRAGPLKAWPLTRSTSASRAEASRPPTAYPPARLPELETTGNNLNTASRSETLTRKQHQVSGLYETPTRQYRINNYRERKLIPQKRLKSRTKSEYPAELLKRLCFRSH